MKTTLQLTHNCRRGQSMVEFSLVLVVLLLLIMGIADLGRVFFYYISMNDAAEEGVFYGSINAPNNDSHYNNVCTHIVNRAKTALADPNAVITIYFSHDAVSWASCATYPSVAVGDLIKVVVNHSGYPLVTPMLPMFIGRNSVPLNVEVKGNVLKKCAVNTVCDAP